MATVLQLLADGVITPYSGERGGGLSNVPSASVQCQQRCGVQAGCWHAFVLQHAALLQDGWRAAALVPRRMAPPALPSLAPFGAGGGCYPLTHPALLIIPAHPRLQASASLWRRLLRLPRPPRQMPAAARCSWRAERAQGRPQRILLSTVVALPGIEHALLQQGLD